MVEWTYEASLGSFVSWALFGLSILGFSYSISCGEGFVYGIVLGRWNRVTERWWVKIIDVADRDLL